MAQLTSKTVSISQLKPWADNPRSVTKADFERLKKQIKKLGQYKPLVCCPSGKNKYIVLGGNMRLQAYRELGIKKIWISVVKAKIKKDRVEISLSDNDRVGFYDGPKLADLISTIKDDLNLGDFKIDLKVPDIDLSNVLGFFSGLPKEKEVDETIETRNKCPKCGYEW